MCSPELAKLLSSSLCGGSRTLDKYQCKMCGYVYDPQVGDPDGKVAAGTPFADLPAGWVCPLCGAGREEFEKVA